MARCLRPQRCVYVEEPVYDEFVAKVTAKVDKLRQGPPGGYGSVDVGAITFPAQMDVIENHVADAFDKGARIVAGGHRLPGPGRFFEPTVLVDVNHTMDCMTEETFGPLLPIMKVRNEQEAVRLANDSPYGLGSSIFTRDIAKAERLARRLTAGNTWINDAIMSYLAQEAPFAGARQSGLGVATANKASASTAKPTPFSPAASHSHANPRCSPIQRADHKYLND